MQPGVQRFDSLPELRDFVIETLCARDRLDRSGVRVSERLLVRSGRPCGMFFCVHGPRAVVFTAIWETDRNTVIFYDSTGERFHRTQLMAAPRLAA